MEIRSVGRSLKYSAHITPTTISRSIMPLSLSLPPTQMDLCPRLSANFHVTQTEDLPRRLASYPPRIINNIPLLATRCRSFRMMALSPPAQHLYISGSASLRPKYTRCLLRHTHRLSSGTYLEVCSSTCSPPVESANHFADKLGLHRGPTTQKVTAAGEQATSTNTPRGRLIHCIQFLGIEDDAWFQRVIQTRATILVTLF